MVDKNQVKLTDEQRQYILDNFDPEVNKNYSIKNFLNRKIYALPDNTIGLQPLLKTGLRVPGDYVITEETTYRELYLHLQNNYDFPA